MTSLNTSPVPKGRRNVIKASDVYMSFGRTPALAGATLAVAPRRDPCE